MSQTTPDAAIPPTLQYEPSAEDGQFCVERNADGLTIIAAPLGWSRRLFVMFFVGSVLLLIPVGLMAVDWIRVLRVDAFVLYSSCVAVSIFGAYILAYAYHLCGRRTRIDVDGRRLRRTILSPFGRWEQTWDIRHITGIVRHGETDRPKDKATYLFYLLYVRTREGKQYPLLDTPDLKDMERVTVALREVLDLPE